MRFQPSFVAVAALAGATSAYPTIPPSKCGPFKGSFHVKQYQLYPENADFDFNSCKLYIGYASIRRYCSMTDVM